MEGWWFSRPDGVLGYGDGRVARVGETHTVERPVVLCEHGLHMSVRVADALDYAPGPLLWRVVAGGEVVQGDDKLAGTERTYIACADATEMLRAYARWCALSVAHLWDVPDVVARWLVTGDESLRAAAMDAAMDAACDAAWAARAAARGATAAASAAVEWGAARGATAAASAAVGWGAARDANRGMLESMAQSLMAGDCWWSEEAREGV